METFGLFSFLPFSIPLATVTSCFARDYEYRGPDVTPD
jgi:hypothetical protein